LKRYIPRSYRISKEGKVQFVKENRDAKETWQSSVSKDYESSEPHSRETLANQDAKEEELCSKENTKSTSPYSRTDTTGLESDVKQEPIRSVDAQSAITPNSEDADVEISTSTPEQRREKRLQAQRRRRKKRGGLVPWKNRDDKAVDENNMPESKGRVKDAWGTTPEVKEIKATVKEELSKERRKAEDRKARMQKEIVVGSTKIAYV